MNKINLKSIIISLLYTIHFIQKTGYHIYLDNYEYTLNQNNKLIIYMQYTLSRNSFSERKYFDQIKQTLNEIEIESNSPYISMLNEMPDSILDLIKNLSEM